MRRPGGKKEKTNNFVTDLSVMNLNIHIDHHQ